MSHRDQVYNLWASVIRPAMAEDFDFKSRKQAESALTFLKELVEGMEVDKIYFEDDEE